MPRVPGAAVERIVAFVRHEHVGDVGGAEHDRARGAEARHHHGILRRDRAGARAATCLGSQAGDFDRALHGDRQSAEGSPRRSGGGCPILRACVGECSVGADVDERVHAGVHTRDPIEMRADDFDRRHVANGNRVHDLGGWPQEQRFHTVLSV